MIFLAILATFGASVWTLFVMYASITRPIKTPHNNPLRKRETGRETKPING